MGKWGGREDDMWCLGEEEISRPKSKQPARTDQFTANRARRRVQSCDMSSPAAAAAASPPPPPPPHHLLLLLLMLVMQH